MDKENTIDFFNNEKEKSANLKSNSDYLSLTELTLLILISVGSSLLVKYLYKTYLGWPS